MELPDSLMGAVVGEGEKYFFTVDCPIGVQEHIHICIKRNNKFVLICASRLLQGKQYWPWPLP